MITTCPHCGRGVATGETLIHTARLGWVPSLCCNGDGPRDDGTRERVLNHLWFYVSIRNDRGETRLITGPFSTYDAARTDIARAKNAAGAYDPWAQFMAFGVASSLVVYNTVFGLPA